MAEGLTEKIISDFRKMNSRVFLIQNSDGFLFREDVMEELVKGGFKISSQSGLERRMVYELREPEERLIFLSAESRDYPEDMIRNSVSVKWSLRDYFSAYHLPSLLNQPLSLLDKLYREDQILSLNKQETLKRIDELKTSLPDKPSPTEIAESFINRSLELLKENPINWSVLARESAKALNESIGTKAFDPVYAYINEINRRFQEKLEKDYSSLKSSNAVNSPKIVSKILDYLDFNFRNEKLALIVIDGMSLWQYQLLADQLSLAKKEELIYSWLPSITQLSRQAIFRGGLPQSEYRQGPASEEKLWKEFWMSRGIIDFEISYFHNKWVFEKMKNSSKLAWVLTGLDEYMHSSKDYKDLEGLTRNWIEREKIPERIKELNEAGFNVFITTDHGNIQARGWRNLKAAEKLGTHGSGSRSQRHLEYSKEELIEDFFEKNPELEESIVREDRTAYFKNDMSFSMADVSVTHGGSHILEVLIPFIEIKNEG